MESTHNNDQNVLHFSHPHPLECTTSTSTANNVTCFGCKLSLVYGEAYYHCKPCAFSLHHVCYKMPLITKHPAHSRHDLILLVIPSSPATKATLKCMACGHHVTGFCYHCAECSSIFFHTFCLTLPLSITVTRHLHRMELAFSPPYDFFCDLCNKPSYRGWLYRCSMCEFDTHIVCAVETIEPQSVEHPSFPQSNVLIRQLHGNKGLNASVGDGTSSMIMRLVAQQIGGGGGGGIRSQELCCDSAAVAAWDKKLNSPRRLHKTISLGKTKLIELQEKIPAEFAAYLEERTPLRDKLTPLSDTNTPSHQFSEACFSIDLAKSYSAHDRKNQVGKDTESDTINRSVVSSERIVSNSGQARPFGVVINNGSDNGSHQNELNSAIFEGLGESSQKVIVKNSNESLARWSIKDQTVTKSDSERENRSGWRKCLPCCL